MLSPIEVETLARNTVRRVLQGAKSEDSIVELKSILPVDHRLAAKQIAGLCNASPGSDAVWVVGVSEKGQFFAPTQEFATWAPAVNKFFDEVYPIARSYNIAVDDHPLTLIHFITEQRPFVVTNQGGIKEVPWRHLNTTLGIRRSELLGLIVPLKAKPELKILRAYVTRERNGGPLNFGMTVYLIPRSESKVVLPLYKSRLWFEMGGATLWIPAPSIQWFEHGVPPVPPLQFVFTEPSFFSLTGRHHQPNLPDLLPDPLKIILQLGYASIDEGDAIAVDIPQTNLAPGVQHFEWREAGWTLN